MYGKSEHVFDLNGNTLQSLTFTWEPSTSQWRSDYKEESAFDENGNIFADSLYSWDASSEQWMGISKNTYSYNPEGATSMITVFSPSESNNLWMPAGRTIYYYPRQVTLAPGVTEHKIIVYPNPSREYITFNLQTASVSISIEIWDLEGRKLLEQVLPEKQTVNIGELASGMYICKIKSGESIYTTKVLKE
jgi:hypothetical protein